NVKAIVFSGYSADPIVSDYRAYGFKEVLPKPYDIAELIHILNKVIAE
nr:response regulator [bacterium]